MTRRRKVAEGYPWRVYYNFGPRVWSIWYQPIKARRVYLYREQPETHSRAQAKRMALQAFGRLMGQSNQIETFQDLWQGYRDWQESLAKTSPWRKADQTLESDLQHIKKPLGVFGKMHPDSIGPGLLKQYQDKRAKTVSNHELTLMSTVFRWGIEREYCRENPASKIRKIPTSRAKRVVTLEQLEAMVPIAQARGPQATIQIAACLAAFITVKRGSEILRLERSNISEEGLTFRASKKRAGQAEKHVLIQWSPKLRAAIDLALNASRFDLCRLVFPTDEGTEYSRSGWSSGMRRLMAAAKAQNPSFESFRLKDCRPGGATKKVADGHNDTVEAMQHSSSAMLNKHYDRNPIKKATPAA